jgi:transcriptional regulator with XRE-family HTH domain
MGKSEFAEYTKKLRIKSGLTQQDVAKALKVQSGQLVSNWERGKCYPPVRLIKKLSKLYNVAVRDIFDSFAENQKEDLWKKVSKQA